MKVESSSISDFVIFIYHRSLKECQDRIGQSGDRSKFRQSGNRRSANNFVLQNNTIIDKSDKFGWVSALKGDHFRLEEVLPERKEGKITFTKVMKMTLLIKN